MTTIRQLIQTSPARANELFAKLAETSDGAVKTRERLFAELKAELEQHTSLEEQHLFPVLRRNPETRGLVADAVKDNKELRAKLAELDALPKDDAGRWTSYRLSSARQALEKRRQRAGVSAPPDRLEHRTVLAPSRAPRAGTGRRCRCAASRTTLARGARPRAGRDEGMSTPGEPRDDRGLRHHRRAVLGVEQGLALQQDTGDPEQPLGDAAQGAAVGGRAP